MLASITCESRRGRERKEPVDGRLELQGEQEWLVSGAPDEVERVREALGEFAEHLSRDVLLVSFRNAVGIFQVPGYATIEVVSGKWDRGHFNRMLADLTRIAAGLPFSGPGAAALPYERSVAAQQDVLYHRFVYLRYIFSDDPPAHERLLPALRQILGRPHRRLRLRQEEVPLERAHRLDAAMLYDLIAPRGGSIVVPPDRRARLPLAAQLAGRLPRVVRERQVDASLDTPENRFVKAFLGLAATTIAQMRELMRSRVARQARHLHERRVLADCDAMDRALLPVMHHALWRSVGRMVHVPAASNVLQRRHGYREVFAHYSRLGLATRIPLDPVLVADLLENKDIAQLYELWCFFTVAEQLEALLGRPVFAGRPAADEVEVKVRRDLEVRWANKTSLLYNASFSRSQGLQRRSYSLPLRPDVALHVAAGPNAGLHLFDAKFKVDRLAGWLDKAVAGEDPTVEAEERSGTFKRGDIYKMHAYRDAIPQTHSVWILYPGAEAIYFSRQGGPSDLGESSLPAPLEGVGALPLHPDEAGHAELARVVAALVRA